MVELHFYDSLDNVVKLVVKVKKQRPKNIGVLVGARHKSYIKVDQRDKDG